jgi:hypothetical protein
VTNLPAPNLTNAIHPIFAAVNFSALQPNDYTYLDPAMRLASRFITEDKYLPFWDWMTAGMPEKWIRNNRGSVRDVTEHIIPDPVHASLTPAAIRKMTRNQLTVLARQITFFDMDAQWSDGDDRVGETFMDQDDRDCKQHRAMHGGQVCGNCKYYRASQITQVCVICGDRWCNKKTKPDLIQHCTSRQLKNLGRLTKQEIYNRLEALNAQELAQPVPVETYRTTDTQRSGFQIGMHSDFSKHIREQATTGWSEAEELRFQFGVAATLVHKLVHVFWFNTTRRCWACFDDDPWCKKKEHTFETEAELGNSWEYWAFGSRVPCGGRIGNPISLNESNLFQQSQWSTIWSTVEGGRSVHDVYEHDYVLPVEYFSEWFQDATWQRIAANGREAGRPAHTNVVLMKEELTDVGASDKYKKFDCTIATLSFATLVS